VYLDLDVHYGDGVAAAFRGAGARGQILTLSIHHAGPGFFPASEHSALPDISSTAFDPFALSLPLLTGASCATFARVWRAVDRVLEAFAPDYVVMQCGVDGLAEDPVGAWNWTLGGEGGLAWCIQRVLDLSAKVLLLGGGTVLVRSFFFGPSHTFQVGTVLSTPLVRGHCSLRLRYVSLQGDTYSGSPGLNSVVCPSLLTRQSLITPAFRCMRHPLF